MPSSKHRKQLVRDTVRRFYHLPARTIARHLIANYGELFDNDLELARSAVRNVLGTVGQKNRDEVKDKSLFREPGEVMAIPPTWRRTRTPHHLSPGAWLVLGDLHVPFHEPKPVETVLSWGESNKVDGILINGDFQDCESLSYWPTAHRDFNKELELCIDFLDMLRSRFPNAKIVYKPGNHEYRLPRKFIEKIPEMAESPLAAMETYMGFEERGIEFLDYFQIVMAGKLPVLHGHEVPFLQRTVNPARGLFLRTKSFAACGHCHTTSEHTTRDINGLVITTWSFGCLCDLSPDWNPYGNDWNWGAAIINVAKSGDFEVENRRILPNGDMR